LYQRKVILKYKLQDDQKIKKDVDTGLDHHHQKDKKMKY
jgi:hypothetical protein